MAIYLALNAALLRARDRLLDLVDRADAFPHLLRVIFWALLAVATAGALLDHGAWTRKESFPGPFRLSDQWPDRYAVNIGAGIPFWLGLRLIQAVPGRESTLMGPRLLLAGRDIGLPQMPQPEIAQGAARWLGARERELSFALPNGVSNDSGLLLSVSYVVRFHSTFYDVARWGFGLIVLLRLVLARRWIGRNLGPADGAISGPLYRYAPYLLAFFPLASAVVIAACAAYATTIVYGIYAGYALPTTAVFHFGTSDLLADIEPYFPPTILIFAAMGTGFAWAATLGIVPVKSHQRMERRLAHIWGWWGLPVILCLFLFSLSAGGWSGHIRPQDQNYQSLAGSDPSFGRPSIFHRRLSPGILGRMGCAGQPATCGGSVPRAHRVRGTVLLCRYAVGAARADCGCALSRIPHRRATLWHLGSNRIRGLYLHNDAIVSLYDSERAACFNMDLIFDCVPHRSISPQFFVPCLDRPRRTDTCACHPTWEPIDGPVPDAVDRNFIRDGAARARLGLYTDLRCRPWRCRTQWFAWLALCCSKR